MTYRAYYYYNQGLTAGNGVADIWTEAPNHIVEQEIEKIITAKHRYKYMKIRYFHELKEKHGDIYIGKRG